MSRRDNVEFRCASCRMHESLCVCSLIPRIDTKTRVVLMVHRTEIRKPTNTGRLAIQCLTNSEIIERGHESEPTLPFEPGDGTEPLLLFPHEDAVPLDTIARSDKPVTLVVPDGTWRQAFKVRNRVPGLRNVRCVTLPHDAPSIYRLRAEAHPHGLATAEAIARALGILEGSHVREALENVFRAMVERTLWIRGDVDTDEVASGIPAGVVRHDPQSGIRSSD